MESETNFPYIGKNLFGYPYNMEAPPNEKEYGNTYEGYANNARAVLLYDFAVQGYDVRFKYNGHEYHLLYEPDHAALCDDKYTIEYQRFDNPMELIKHLKIEGHPLISIIDKLDDVEPM